MIRSEGDLIIPNHTVKSTYAYSPVNKYSQNGLCIVICTNLVMGYMGLLRSASEIFNGKLTQWSPRSFVDTMIRREGMHPDARVLTLIRGEGIHPVSV